MIVPKLILSRLTLREIKSKDVFAYTELFSDKETMELFGGRPVLNDLEIKDVIETTRQESEKGCAIFWAITLTEEKEFIGFIRLMSYKTSYYDSSFSAMGEMRNSSEILQYIDRNGWEIEYALLKNFRGKGIMKEALEAILGYCTENGIGPLFAKVGSLSNTATVHLLEKSGFTELLPQVNHKGGLGMIYKWT